MIKFLIIFISLMLSYNYTHSFTTSCIPEDTCTWYGYVDSLDLSEYDHLEMKSIVHYRAQKCNGVIRYIIDSAVAINNSTFLDTISIEEMTFSAFNDLIEINLMLKTTMFFNSLIPECGSDTVVNIQYYTAACGVWVKCSYKVDPTLVQCDTGFSPPQPHYYLNGEYWIDVWRWHSCGTACCEKKYKMCLENVEVPLNWKQLKITQLTKQRIGECTLQQQFKNWRNPSQIVPCKDDC